jgi:hypothetical protein
MKIREHPMGKPIFIAMLSTLAWSIPAVAQTSTPTLLSIARVQVKPDRAAEWQDIEGKYTEAYKKAGGTVRFVYRGSDSPYEYLVVTSIPSYSSMDGDSIYVKGSSAAAIAGLSARRNQCVTSVQVTYERPVPELAITTEGPSTAKVYRFVRTQVRPGMMDDYLALMKNEVLPALKKGGVKDYRARRIEYGGSRDVITTRIGLSSWAELDGPSAIEKALGKDGAAALLKKVQALATSQYLLYTPVPAISFVTQ